jgi:hypothetical protein
MPVQDWSRVDAGIFHHFHHDWISELARALNRRVLPSDYYAMAEQIAAGLGPDVLTLQKPRNGAAPGKPRAERAGTGLLLAEAPPKVRFHIRNEPKWYATQKAKLVAIRHVSDHRVVAIIEIVSPGNKDSENALASFVRKVREFLAGGIHMLVLDVFPPGPCDPEGIHPAIWGEDPADPFRFDPAKPLTCASYTGGPGPFAFVEPLAVGDRLVDMPLCLTIEEYVPVPLEATYEAAFAAVPDYWQDVLTGPGSSG